MKSLTSRLGVGIADQALSSILGLAVAVAVARSVPAGAFGAFALAQATYYVALGASRALTTEPFSVRFSGVSPDVFDRQAPQAAGAALVVAVGASLACTVAAGLAADALRSALMALAIALPVLLVHDCLRFAAFSQARGNVALVSDMVWVAGVGVAMGTAIAVGTSSVGLLLLAWGAPALAGAMWSSARLGVIPDPRGAFIWWRSQRELAPRYLGEFAASSGAGQVAQYLVGAIAGLVAAGALRAGQVLLGPLNVLFMGTQAVVIPEAVGLARRSAQSLVRLSVIVSSVLTAAAVTWGIGVTLLPGSVGRALLGESWVAGSAIAPIMAVSMAASGALMGALVGLRALAAARRSLRVRTIVSPFILGGASLGASLGDARGAAVGLSAAMWLAAALWWHAYLHELRSARRGVLAHRAADASLVPASDA